LGHRATVDQANRWPASIASHWAAPTSCLG
jgi:hypothetical protein